MPEKRGFWNWLVGDRSEERRREAFQHGDWQAAAGACREVLKTDPYNRKALHDLAVSAARLGQDDEAYDACRRLGLLDSGRMPDDQPAHQATELLAKVEEGQLHLRYAQHLPVLGELLAARGRVDLAEPLLRVLVDMPKAFPSAVGSLAWLRAQRGDLAGVRELAGRLRRGPAPIFEQTMKRLQELAAHRPADLKFLRCLVELLAEGGRLESAEQTALRRLASDPGNRPALAVAGLARLHAGQLGAATEHFRAWIQAHPEDEAGYRGLAMVARESGDLRAEARALRELARRFPKLAEEALDQLRLSAADPDTDPVVQGHLAALLLARGDLDSALTAWRSVSEAAAQDPAVGEQARILRELQEERRIQEYRLLLTPPADGTWPARIALRYGGRKVELTPSADFRRAALEQTQGRTAIDPSRLRLELGRLLLDRSRAEAIQHLQAVLRDSAELRHAALYLLGVAFLEDGYVEPAHRAFAAVDPQLPGLPAAQKPDLLYDIAIRAEAQGWLDTALKALSALLVLDQGHKDARLRFERVQAVLASSPRERERAAAALPASQRIEALYAAALDYEGQGDEQNAIRAWEDVLLLDLGYKDAKARFDKLAAKHAPSAAARKTSSRFEDRVLLGKGGMGTVYKAFDKRLRREVAIKVINERYQGDPAAVARFRREAQAAAALPPHPGLVTVYDISEDEELAIVMEFVLGESLRELLRREGALPEARAVALMRPVAEALAHAHKQGVVHRDMKPDNVMLARSGEVKVTDFGLAHLDSASVLTTIGEVMGTTLYMPPEQIRGQKADARSDIYSLGVTLYELLVGAPPFVDGDVAFRHVYETPESPRCRRPELSPALEAVVLRCLAKAPEERYADCGALLAELLARSG